MRIFVLAFSVAAAAILAACGGQTASSGPALSQSALPQAVAHALRPHSPYEAWVYNDDPTHVLHVWNTYGGQCMSKEFPRIDLQPKQSWSGVLDSVTSGWCFFTSNVQYVRYWYVDDKGGNFNELDYHKPAHSQLWFVDRTGGEGGFQKASLNAPLRTHCQLNGNGLIVCSVGNS